MENAFKEIRFKSISVVFIIIIVAILFSLKVSAKNNSDSIVRVPVLKECVTDAKDRIGKMPKKMEIDAVYKEFDRTLYTHPSVAGVIEVKSLKHSRAYLLEIANAYITECDIDTTIEFKKNSENSIKLFDYIEAAEREGVDTIYLVNEPDKIEILFRSKKTTTDEAVENRG